MALDFPTSPTDGQIFANWIYSSTKGAWEAKPLTAGVATPSPTAPLAPKQGDLWYNTEDGNTYVWYTDVDGSQWVQLKSDATLSSTLGTRVSSLEAVPTGLVDLVPGSITLGSGTGSVNSSGVVTFTNTTSISLNNIFTSSYSNYRYVIKLRGVSSGTTGLNTRFRASGTTTSTGYYWSGYIAYVAANTLSSYRGNNSTEFLSGFFSGSSYSYGSVDVFSPMLAEPTGFVTQSTGSDGNYFSLNNSGFQIDNTLFDGITFSTSANSMTGTVQVFGYR